MHLKSKTQPKTFKVRIIDMDRNKKLMTCQHKTGFIVKMSYNPAGTDYAIGQMIEVAYKSNQMVTGYVITDNLIQIVDARVLEAQHIIENEKLYTSVIFEDTRTKKRMHSLVPYSSTIFPQTVILISGDIVKLKLNNGELFEILQPDIAVKRH